MNRLVIIVSVSMGMAGPAFGWLGDAVEEFIALLNTSAVQQAMGLQEARRPEGVVNRLDLVFQGDIPVEQRTQVLQKIGRQFLMVLFDRTQISTVTVLERDASGAVLRQAVIRVIGSSQRSRETLSDVAATTDNSA